MAVIFASSSAYDFTGNMTEYTGAAVSRDPDYSDSEIAIAFTSSVSNPWEIPNITPSGTLIWLHMRAWFPAESDNSGADGRWIDFYDSTGDAVGGIDCINGNLRVYVQPSITEFTGAAWSHTVETLYTLDILMECDGVNQTCTLYVDGVQVSTVTQAGTKGVTRRVDFITDDCKGISGGTPNGYFSEIIIDDADSTLGCRLHQARPDSTGTYSEMSGDIGDLLYYLDSASLASTATGERFSWNPPSYSGDLSNPSVRAVIGSVSFIGGSSGPPTLEQFLRVGGTDYYGDKHVGIASGVTNAQYTWALDPSDSLAWDIGDMGSFEVGVRSNTV